jgi:ADP-dependent NAD(P)H-hydrate dehydratase / NAD(P)H-hydrate epimerase
MRFLPVDELRRRDAAAIARGTPAECLMERAGTGLARAIYRLLDACRGQACFFVTGRGNNSGDAFVAARLLERWGVRCTLLLTCAPEALKGAARSAWHAYAAAAPRGSHDVLDSESHWISPRPETVLPPRAVVVDALLGTGARGAPAGVIRAAILWIRQAAARAAIVAVDLPSGMDANSGRCDEVAVQADLTVTFDAPKRGFQFPVAWPWLGRVEVVDIGLPPSAVEPNDDAFCDFLAAGDPDLRLPRRPRDSHKGDFGHLLVIGGSHGFAGAPALVALAALRTGAGLVSAVVPDCAAAPIAALAPEAMAHPLPSPNGCLDWQRVRQWKADLSPFDTLVVGPGLGTGAGPRELVEGLLADNPERMLLDADALNILALQQTLHRLGSAEHVILTPHPGEAARLLGTSVVAVQADRPAAVRQLADATGAIVVLKGGSTLVCAPGGRPQMNVAGNPGMATGGSGDVLSGVIGALWGQGLGAWNAARLGVCVHAAAGDLAAWQEGEATLIARDIIAHLGGAFKMNGAGAC